MNHKVWICVIILLCSVIAYAEEGCTVYDSVDNVYLQDNNCDGWPDDVARTEEQNLPPMPQVEDTAIAEPEESQPVAAQVGVNNLEIDYIGQRGIAAGKADYYAIKIVNHDRQPAVIDVQIDSIKDWGTYRLEPGSRMIVQPGKEESLFIFITADADAEPGDHQVIVHLKTDSEEKTLKLNANIISEAKLSVSNTKLEIVLIILVLIILIIGLILGYDRLRKGKKEEEHSYY